MAPGRPSARPPAAACAACLLARSSLLHPAPLLLCVQGHPCTLRLPVHWARMTRCTRASDTGPRAPAEEAVHTWLNFFT